MSGEEGMLLFRLAKQEDFETIVTFPRNAEEAYYMFPRGTYPLQADALYQVSCERKLPIVLEKEGRIAAYCSLYDVAEGGAGWLGNVITAPEARGGGTAENLIRYMMKRSREEFRLAELHLVCHSSNARALLFYHRLGFQPYDLKKTEDWESKPIARIYLKQSLLEA